MEKEIMRCPDGTSMEIGVISFKELESMRDSKFKWIKKGMKFLMRVLKALKLQMQR